jgi:hypothetical protein
MTTEAKLVFNRTLHKKMKMTYTTSKHGEQNLTDL